MTTKKLLMHPLFQPGLMPVTKERKVGTEHAIVEAPVSLDTAPADRESKLAGALLHQYRRRRSGWLRHFRSFLGVNAGLAAINILSSIGAGSIYPWFLYITASWGIGLLIHGLGYKGWAKDHAMAIEAAEQRLGISRLSAPFSQTSQRIEQINEVGSVEPALTDGSVDDHGWSALIADCRDAVGAARGALDDAKASPEVCEQAKERLDGALEIVEAVQRGAQVIQRAIAEVAPSGFPALEAELRDTDGRIEATTDERLRNVLKANQGLLAARRDKLLALQAEEERLRATVKGVLLSAQNIRLDAARLGAGHAPDLIDSLSESLDRLNDEVEVARQVEQELLTMIR